MIGAAYYRTEGVETEFRRRRSNTGSIGGVDRTAHSS
jgi:hypothetical protein